MAEDAWTMPKGELMRGKKGLVMGVANQNSIAWGIASQLAAQGAELAFTYLGEGLERRVRPLAESIGCDFLIPADVTDDASMEAAFAEIEWRSASGTIDFFVHSVAFADKNELKGSFVENTSRAGFLLAMNISAFSFVDCARRAAKLMPNGGSMVTMTYLGLRADHSQLQHHGRGQGGAGGGDALHRARSWPQGHSRERHLRRAPCAPCRWPASPAVAA